MHWKLWLEKFPLRSILAAGLDSMATIEATIEAKIKANSNNSFMVRRQ